MRNNINHIQTSSMASILLFTLLSCFRIDPGKDDTPFYRSSEPEVFKNDILVGPSIFDYSATNLIIKEKTTESELRKMYPSMPNQRLTYLKPQKKSY